MTRYPKIIGLQAIPIEIIGKREFAISEGKTKTHKSVIVRVLTEDPKIDGVAEIVCAPPGKPEEICGKLIGQPYDSHRNVIGHHIGDR